MGLRVAAVGLFVGACVLLGVVGWSAVRAPAGLDPVQPQHVRHLLQPGQNLDVDRESRMGGGEPLKKLLYAFMKALPIPWFTWDTIYGYVNGTADTSNIQSQATNWGIRFGIFLGLPLIMGILTTCCICPCFFCCRLCCNCCGGRAPKEEGYNRNQMLCPVGTEVIIAIFIFVFVVIGLTFNTRFNQGVNDLFDDVDGIAKDLFDRADAVLNLADQTVNIVNNNLNGLGPLLTDSKYNGTQLGPYLAAQYQPQVDTLNRSLTALQDSLNSTSDMVAAARARMVRLSSDVEDLRTELYDLNGAMQNASTRTVNGKTYSTGVPNIDGIAKNLPNLTDDHPLDPAQSQLAGLPNFYNTRDKVLADWANVTQKIQNQVDDANNQLTSTVTDIVSQSRTQLNGLRNGVNDARNSTTDYQKTLKDVQTQFNKYDAYRQLVMQLPMYILLAGMFTGIAGIIVGFVRKKRHSPLFTIMVLCSFFVSVLLWLNFFLYYPLSWFIGNVCYLIDPAVNYGLAQQNQAKKLYDECMKPDGNVFNSGIVNVTDSLRQAGVCDAPDTIRKQVGNSLNSSNAFNNGGQDVGGNVRNASNVNFGNNTYNFDVNNDLGYNMTQITLDTNTALNNLSPATFNFSQSYVYEALDAFNNYTLALNGSYYTLENYTCAEPTLTAMTPYSTPEEKANATVLYLALNATVALNQTVENTLAELRGTITGLRDRAQVDDTTMVKPLEKNITELQADYAAINAAFNRSQERGQEATAASDALTSGLNNAYQGVISPLVDAVADGVGNTIAQVVAMLPQIGACGWVGRDYRALRTDICESITGSMAIMWCCAALCGLLLMGQVCAGVLGGKRWYHPEQDTFTPKDDPTNDQTVRINPKENVTYAAGGVALGSGLAAPQTQGSSTRSRSSSDSSAEGRPSSTIGPRVVTIELESIADRPPAFMASVDDIGDIHPPMPVSQPIIYSPPPPLMQDSRPPSFYAPPPPPPVFGLDAPPSYSVQQNMPPAKEGFESGW